MVGRGAAFRTTAHPSNKPPRVFFDLNRAWLPPLKGREARLRRTFTTFLAVINTATSLFAQGMINFANTTVTQISAGGVAMPGANTSQFIFAVFLAPSTTVNGVGQIVSFDDPAFQLVGAYDTNHPSASGRLVTRNNVAVLGFDRGSTVDFVVRGWSANAGATWAEALARWKLGLVQDMYLGSSFVGNDLVLGDGAAFPATTLFGPGPTQVGGFNMSYLGCLGPYLFMFYPMTSQTVVQGDSATFTFGGAACPGAYHQWYFNGIALPDALNPSMLVIANAQPQNAGRYTIVWSNFWWGPGTPTGWHTISDSALLTVLVPPTITSSPSSQTTETGARVRLTADVAGDMPLAYRWIFNETITLNGATNSVLELDNVSPSQSGAYFVVVTNSVGAVTSAPAMLSVIPVVERRMVPGILITAPPGLLNVDSIDSLSPAPNWSTLDSVSLSSPWQYWFDLTTPLPSQRFYRVWQGGLPSAIPVLDLQMIPAITLTGKLGDSVRVDGINQFGPTDAWFTLDTVSLTNSSQLYFDVTSVGQLPRLWRVVPVP
jgi:hypothetical protein